jgi:hypothetical protein
MIAEIDEVMRNFYVWVVKEDGMLPKKVGEVEAQMSLLLFATWLQWPCAIR